MGKDISFILSDWAYEPGKISARKIVGDDGRPKIQFRLDLGVLQMEIEGRPDGQRPYGCESVLEYLEKALEQHRRRQASAEGFTVDAADCERLRTESLQYYHRYLCEFVLEEYAAVVRDTDRNLRMLDFCGRYAREESDRFALEQYRPYMLMMNVRARGQLLFQGRHPDEARALVRGGLESLRQFYARFGQEEFYATSKEVAALEELLREIEGQMTPDPVGQLKRLLAKAVEEERYEEAARLRDQIARQAKPDLPEV